MKAVVLCGRGKVEYREVEKPQIGERDLLIEVKACGICGSDLHFFYGGMEPIGEVPLVMGHEFAGIIVEKGKEVEDYWQIGDRVVSDNTGGACGRCANCARGNFVACEQRQTMGITMDGGFTKYVKIPGSLLEMYKNCLWKIPENLSFEEATLMDPAANGYNAVVQQGNLKSGEIVVVFGVGALGLMSIAQASIAGASKIIAVGMKADRKRREKIARKYGADEFFASDEEENIVEKVKEAAREDGVALVVDAAGVPALTSAAIQIVRSEGSIVRIGMSNKTYEDSLDGFSLKNIRFSGHMGYNQESWRNTLALAKAEKLNLKPIITCILPLEEYQQGFDMTKNQEASKVVLVP